MPDYKIFHLSDFNIYLITYFAGVNTSEASDLDWWGGEGGGGWWCGYQLKIYVTELISQADHWHYSFMEYSENYLILYSM